MSELQTIEHEAQERWGKIVKRSGEDVYFVCPSCAHESLSVHTGRGCFHCFRCGYGRSQPKLKGQSTLNSDKVPVNLDHLFEVAQAILSVSKLDPLHEKYLKGRGIYRPNYWGIVTVPPQLHRRMLPLFGREKLLTSGLFNEDQDESVIPAPLLEWRRILVPYWHGDRIVGVKTRENPYSFEDTPAERRWSTSRGSKIGSHLFYRGSFGEDVLFSEGELKIAAACDVGFTGGGSPGMNASSAVLSQLGDKMKKAGSKRLFIINDTEAGMWDNYALMQATNRTANVFHKHSAIGFLPQDSSSEKMDLDLFLVRHGEKELDHLLELFWRNRETTFDRVAKRVKELAPRR